MTNDPSAARPFHVLIAGGGSAALETMMALRALAGERVLITLLAPERDYRYRPMAVAEPYTSAPARHIALVAIAHDFGARHVRGELESIDPQARTACTSAGDRIEYDALVIACGTRPHAALAGALTIDDRAIGATLRGLWQEIEQGSTREIAFVAQPRASWPLPLYELALLTAQRAHDLGADVDVDMCLVSPEPAPLALFGAAVADDLSVLLRDAGITFHGASTARAVGDELRLEPSGLRLRPDQIVALPVLEGPRIAGVPADQHGFIPVTEHGEVEGLPGLYAAGDATAHPVKHGGIAAQQADAVAAAIAVAAGVENAAPRPPRPVLRGELLTGGAPRYFEAERLADGGLRSTVSEVCPWDPPTKVAARHLGAYLHDGDRFVAGEGVGVARPA